MKVFVKEDPRRLSIDVPLIDIYTRDHRIQDSIADQKCNLLLLPNVFWVSQFDRCHSVDIELMYIRLSLCNKI